MKFSVFQVSRKGGRDNNEDRMGYSYTRDAALLVLADGMGGHPEGQVAAQLAIETVSSMFREVAAPVLPDPNGFLSAAVLAAHHQILQYASNRAMLDTPRTTLVAAVLQGGKAHWVHCGDSRLYLVRGGTLLRRTRDHSFSEQGGALRVKSNPLNRNILFTCLGSPTRPIYDLAEPVVLQEHDRLTLCSDGLWSNVSEEAIVSQLSSHAIAQAVPDLVEEALRTAGERCDNVTALAVDWEISPEVREPDSISTDSISDGEFATTIQADFIDGDDELDDAAIERSIAEINEAIKRTAARCA